MFGTQKSVDMTSSGKNGFNIRTNAKLTVPKDWQEQIQVGSRSVALRRVQRKWDPIYNCQTLLIQKNLSDCIQGFKEVNECVFFGSSKMAPLANPSIKVAHCTQMNGIINYPGILYMFCNDLVMLIFMFGVLFVSFFYFHFQGFQGKKTHLDTITVPIFLFLNNYRKSGYFCCRLILAILRVN